MSKDSDVLHRGNRPVEQPDTRLIVHFADVSHRALAHGAMPVSPASSNLAGTSSHRKGGHPKWDAPNAPSEPEFDGFSQS